MFSTYFSSLAGFLPNHPWAMAHPANAPPSRWYPASCSANTAETISAFSYPALIVLLWFIVSVMVFIASSATGG